MTENLDYSSPPESSAMPDWKCSFCGLLNPAHLLSCRECSKTRVESDDNFFNIIANDEQKTKYPHPSLKKSHNFSTFIDQIKIKFSNKHLKISVPIIAVFLTAFIMYFAFRNERIRYRVVEVKWERSLVFKSKTKGPDRVFKLDGRDNIPRWPEPNFAKNIAANIEKQPKKTEKYSALLERVSSHSKAPNLVTIIPSNEEFISTYRIGAEIKLILKSDSTLLPTSGNASVKKQDR